MKCEHRRIKKVYSHGRKSKPMLVCKRCGEVIKRYEWKKELEKKRKNKYKRRK